MLAKAAAAMASALMLSATTSARAQGYGIDWITIGDPGNRAYPGDQYGQNTGRGSVAYEYRIGRTEVTTAQWLAFVNTFSTQSDDLANFARPFHWGATTDPEYDGPGRRWKLREGVPTPEMIPVLGIDWRTAAEYCNWLHNGRSSELAALEDGAYDASTFHTNQDGTFTDQATHHPDARYWIPTLDEWLKAAHFDPDLGVDGGWWLYSHRSEEAPVPGFPGEGETTAGLYDNFARAIDVPLGSYPLAASPWGLLDVTGGAEEWTEEIRGRNEFRITEGSGAGERPELYYLDQAGFGFWKTPNDGELLNGLRLVSRIPGPSSFLALFAASIWVVRRTRRMTDENPIDPSRMAAEPAPVDGECSRAGVRHLR